MSVSLDAGDILAQETIDIGPDETAGALEARLAVLGARLAAQVVEQIAAGTAQGIKQDKTQASKAPKLTKEHGRIDWSRPAREVCNQIRAMQPWPTAYTYWHRREKPPQRLIIHKAVWREEKSVLGLAPGQIILQPDRTARLCVSAGTATQVEILELQLAGNRRMTAAEFLRGHRPEPGERLGPETG
jgi:methionyl-tRNA formyltransferase